MDDLDRAILRRLERDARVPNNDLADDVGLSPSACLRRVRALEAAGTIRGYRALVDPAALDRGFEVLVHINLAIKNQASIGEFERRVAELDEIRTCRRMFGDPDYLLEVAVSDAQAYEHFYIRTLTSIRGVGRTHTQLPMRTIKST